jgi:hypothetical protein
LMGGASHAPDEAGREVVAVFFARPVIHFRKLDFRPFAASIHDRGENNCRSRY